jgi:hypothetical protein
MGKEKKMKKVFQTRFGKDGNCWAACIATVFGVELSEVDQCACNNQDWAEQTMRWLQLRGFSYIEIARNKNGGWPITMPQSGTICVLGVKTNRGLPHVVVAEIFADKIGEQDAIGFYLLHDPIPDAPKDCYTEIDAVIFFVARPQSLPIQFQIKP